jgi:hypothetical protein
MTWRDVFDCKAVYHNLEHAARTASMCGYKFLAWNGDILFVLDWTGKTASTGIAVSQLTPTFNVNIVDECIGIVP